MQFVLRAEPCNIKANYTMQLALLRSGDHESLDNMVREQTATYAFFQFPNKKVVLADGQRHRLLAAASRGDALQAATILPQVRRP